MPRHLSQWASSPWPKDRELGFQKRGDGRERDVGSIELEKASEGRDEQRYDERISWVSLIFACTESWFRVRFRGLS